MTNASTAGFPVVAVTGLHAEARKAAAAGVVTIAGGGDGARLALTLETRFIAGARAVISFGIAGGLAPGLPAGTVVIADAVSDGETRWATDRSWHSTLLDALPEAKSGTIFGTDSPIAERSHKAERYRSGGALAVDMESHIAARAAARHGVPFAILRVIADPAEAALPHAALVGMRPDGSVDVFAVLRSLARRPMEIPALIRTALDARAALASLGRSRSRLDASFGFDLREPRSVSKPEIASEPTGAQSDGIDPSVEHTTGPNRARSSAVSVRSRS